MSLRVTCQALPTPGAQRTATNMPAFMMPAKPLHARPVAVLASGNPFTSADREASPAFWRPDCPPDESDARSGPLFSVWPRKAAKKVERPYPTAWEGDSLRAAFRNTIEEVRRCLPGRQEGVITLTCGTGLMYASSAFNGDMREGSIQCWRRCQLA